MKKALITGSAGLIGSESVKFFTKKGYDIVGVDNNMRAYFFGKEASTEWNRKQLEKTIKNYHHVTADIRDNEAIEKIFKQNKFDPRDQELASRIEHLLKHMEQAPV